jgi:hypothetical protein
MNCKLRFRGFQGFVHHDSSFNRFVQNRYKSHVYWFSPSFCVCISMYFGNFFERQNCGFATVGFFALIKVSVYSLLEQ